jgi:hypothetical protein
MEETMGTTPDRQYGRELVTEPELDAKVVSHRDQTLLHELDRAGVLEVVRDTGGRVQFVRARDGAGGPTIRETEVTRDASGRASTIIDRQFDPPGTLARTRSLALARGADNRVSGGTFTVS